MKVTEKLLPITTCVDLAKDNLEAVILRTEDPGELHPEDQRRYREARRRIHKALALLEEASDILELGHPV